jgi:hypothetical protein
LLFNLLRVECGHLFMHLHVQIVVVSHLCDVVIQRTVDLGLIFRLIDRVNTFVEPLGKEGVD